MGADIYDWDRVHGKGSYAAMADAQDKPRSEDIVAFLNARLDEDERYLKSNQHHLWTERPLREVTAKRVLIAAVLRYETIIDGEWGDCHEEDEIAAGLCPEHQPDEMGALRHLAAVWSDHPDYREEWAVLLSSTRTDAAAQRA
jgi:hypothetical protein